jgi:hypothetical protein
MIERLTIGCNSSPIFPVYFRDMFHPNMEITLEPDGTYVLAHPNHIDWYYYIKEDDDERDVWYLAGVCEDSMDEVSMRFVRSDDDGHWMSTNWYM